MPHIATALLILLLSTIPATSQSRADDDDRIANLLARGLVAAREQALLHLFGMAPDGALTRHMAETHDLTAIADGRSSAGARLLRYDLDDDGAISRSEIARLGQIRPTRARAHFDQFIAQADTDSDGTVTSAEVSAFASRTADHLRTHTGRAVLVGSGFMAFDANNHDRVTVEDVLTTIDRVARAHPSRVGTNRPEGNPTCRLPQPSPDAIAVYVGAFHGDAISTIAVSGRDGLTTFATIAIEDGDRPIHLIGNFHDPMVLRFTGATDRVEQFVARGEHGIGVAGLPDDAVDLTSLADCERLSARLAGTSDLVRERAFLIARLGKDVQAVDVRQLGRLALPSGRTAQRAAKPDDIAGFGIERDGRRYRATRDGRLLPSDTSTLSDLYRQFVLRHPGGIESVMPEDVVSDGKVESYDVLPGHAGLIQLIDSGAVRILNDARIAIVEPIARFPAGLTHGYAVEFVLRRGVPMPAGDPGHSSVWIEATGRCRGARC